MEIVNAVKKYSELLDIEYCLILGRKNKSDQVKIVFDKTAWFHVAGLHYLTDIDINQNRRALSSFFDEIIRESITEEYFRKSVYYESILDRSELLSRLGEFIEEIDNKSIGIFGFSKARAKFFTKIDGDYLISDLRNAANPVNMFLVFEKRADGILVPASAFYPDIDKRSGKPLDYTDGQMKYTLLKNTRNNIRENTSVEIYHNPNYREPSDL